MKKRLGVFCDLREFLEKLIKRSDIHFKDNMIGDPVDTKDLELYRPQLPESLIEFYSVMNGCDLLGSFINDSSLALGLRILPIDRIGGFRVPDSTKYRFADGVEMIPLEWIEPNMSFYYLKPAGASIDDAYIVAARPAEEHECIHVADTMEQFAAKVIETSATLGWGYSLEKNGSRDSIDRVSALLIKPPAKIDGFAPGMRVKMSQDRGTVIKQVITEGEHRHFGNRFVLVDLDCAGIFWIKAGNLKKVAGKNDLYESGIANPEKFMADIKNLKPEDSIQAFFRIGSEGYAFRGFDDFKGLSIPDHSFRYAGIFRRLPFESAVTMMTEIFCIWSAASIGKMGKELKFSPDGSEYDKKENDRIFSVASVLSTMLGAIALIYIIHKQKDASNVFPAECAARLLKEADKLLTSPDFPTNSGFPTPFGTNLRSLGDLFTAKQIKSPVFWFPVDRRAEWMDELGLDKPFPFREC